MSRARGRPKMSRRAMPRLRTAFGRRLLELRLARGLSQDRLGVRAPYLDVRAGLFIPCVVAWDPETGEFSRVEGPRGFETWEEAEEAGRFSDPHKASL